jgi:7-cyano-7-deazaguanine synthase
MLLKPFSPSVNPSAVVLLSGGIDSATCAALATRRGYTVHALTVDYGQLHRVELEAARKIGEVVGLKKHHWLKLDLSAIAQSALLGHEPVPLDRPSEHLSEGIPPTYVPARNTILLSLGLALAESIGAADIFIGANVVDYSGYPDCRPEFLAAFEKLANLATRAGVEGGIQFRVHAPLLFLTKAEIIRLGIALGLDLSLTHSCYNPTAEGYACGRCDSCQIRRRGFAEANIPDPTRYAAV